MARCGCAGSTACSCLIQEGPGINVSGTGNLNSPYIISSDGNATTVIDTQTVDMNITGTGTSGDPYVISSLAKIDPALGNLIEVTANGLRVDCAGIAAACGMQSLDVADTNTVDLTLTGDTITADVILDPDVDNLLSDANGLMLECADVWNCFTGSDGVTYDPLTGNISADLSEDPDNALILAGDGLFVPSGTLVATDCGLLGDGTVGDPIRVNTGDFTWPFAECEPQGAFGGRLYCDPITGRIHGEPEKFATTFTANGGTFPGVTNVPNTEEVVDTASVQLVNPSSCHDAVALIVWEADVTFQPAANTQVEMEMNGDGMVQFQQSGGTVTQIALQQARGVRQTIIPAGGVFNFAQDISIVENAGGGSTYNRTQWRVNAIVVNV